MALVSNFNLPDFNCYVSLEEAQTYVEERLHTAPWDNADVKSREAALIWSSKLLDSSFEWRGGRVNIFQPMMFPRNGLFDNDGYYIKSDEIPKQVKMAVVEQAMLLLAKDRTANSEPSSKGLSSLKIGSIQLDFDKWDTAPVIAEQVAVLLAGLFYKQRGIGASVDLVRC